jgi:hypothetical protein
MGSNPINLAVRFLLEIVALLAIGIWGWKQGEGWMRYIWALGIPIIIAVVWSTFAVPDDPSRSGAAPVVVSGIVRLVIELVIFAFATLVLYDMKFTKLSWLFGVIVVIHYIISYDRIQWLMEQ